MLITFKRAMVVALLLWTSCYRREGSPGEGGVRTEHQQERREPTNTFVTPRPLEGTASSREQVRSSEDMEAPSPVQQERVLPTVTKARVGDLDLHLGHDRGHCVVDYSGSGLQGRLLLEVAAPCAFVLGDRKTPLAFTYADVKTTVLVVIGIGGGSTPVVDQDSQLTTLCGMQAQGVLLRPGALEASQRATQGTRICPSLGLDEKEFWLFAH